MDKIVEESEGYNSLVLHLRDTLGDIIIHAANGRRTDVGAISIAAT